MLPACWRTRVVLVCGLVFACFAMPTSSAVAAPPAFLKKGTDLQKVLDTTGELRLAPDIDYRGFRGKPLKVPSRAKILSRWNARLPVLVIEGGVHDVWIEGLDGGGSEEPDIVFTGGMPNRNITIIGGNGGRLGIAGRLKVRLEDDSRVEGLDLAEYGALEVLQGTSGYVRNSVFSHALGYRLGSTIWWEGNEDELSAGNSFFHISSITPQWKSRWHYAGALLLVGWDCESWNGRAKGDANCFEVAHSPALISMGLSGGTVYNSEGGALAIIRDVQLVADFSSRPRGGFRDKADVIFEQVGENFHLFRSDFHLVEKGLNGARSGFFGLHLKPIDTSRMSVGPSVQMRTLLQSYSFPPVAESLATGAFAAPMTAPSSLSVGVYGAVVADQSAVLQELIDREGVARVPPGVYRLSHSLRIGSPQRIEGLVASAPGEVVLIASGNFPVIQGREFSSLTSDGLAQQSVVLSGLALVGGSHGIYWSAERGNVGPGMKVAASTFESLRFISQSVAGVAAIGIEGIDSNSWRRVSFEDMPVALLGVGKGGTLGMNYADKQGFMFCSFRNVRDAVWSWDSERPSGGNFWFRSDFDGIGNVSRTRAGYNLIWFGSSFKDIHAGRALRLLDNGSTATGEFYFISGRWTGHGPSVLADTASGGVGAHLLGSVFQQSETRFVGAGEHEMLLSWGNQIETKVPTIAQGRHLIINTLFSGKRTEFEIAAKGPLTR